MEDFLKLFYFAQTKVYLNRIWNGNAVGKEEDYKLNFFLEKQTSFGNQLNVDFQNWTFVFRQLHIFANHLLNWFETMFCKLKLWKRFNLMAFLLYKTELTLLRQTYSNLL